ncbi:MAG: gamma-glutamyl-phosphate reductase, partial [Sphingomonas sp.]
MSGIESVSLIAELAARARAASARLAGMTSADKARALVAVANAIREDSDAIIAANAEDMAAGTTNGLTAALLDRLRLDEGRVEAMAAGVEAVATLADPVGDVIERVERPNGLILTRVRIPIGVIGIVYESRPNVTADAGALCFMSGNAAILRGGSEAIRSNRAIHAALARGLGDLADAIQLV